MACNKEDSSDPFMQPDSEQMNLLDLNDDCLIKIFSYMTNHQLIKILGVCEKLDEIIQVHLRRCKNLHFNIRSIGEEEDDRKLITAMSPYLTSLTFSIGYSLRVEIGVLAIRPLVDCKRLKSLTLHFTTLGEEYLILIRHISNQLEKIDFSFCRVLDEIVDDFFQYNCGSLKELILIGNYTFFGRSLSHLHDLRKLVIENHENFLPDMPLIKTNNPNAEIVFYEKGRLKLKDVT